MRPRKRDPAFLRMAAIAALGGVVSIGFSIAAPLVAAHQGRAYTPMFSLFAAWGVAALLGSYACLKTYLLTDMPPPKPPGGGVRLELHRGLAAPPAPPVTTANPSQQRAA
jgi:hypothetical protein